MGERLPVYEVEAELVAGLRECPRAVLVAPTGSGKSTQVPGMLLDQGLVAAGERIIVLQPRRLPARMLARRVAQERGGRLGDEVGYSIRFDSQTSGATRIEYVTEGLLLRRMLSDPRLPGVGAILFDEFHERHLEGDLALARALQIQRSARPELKLLVMSATLDAAPIADYLAPCPVHQSEGRQYPVEVRYSGGGPVAEKPIWEQAAYRFRGLAREGLAGDVLIFMPGAYEIRKTIEALEGCPEARGYRLLPLHGELPPEQQDAAVSAGGEPRIVVSTNVAETSLTLEGVRVVIDGGLARVNRHDPRRGINSLLIEPISRQSADQRAGRAGRTAPGICQRLWTEREHERREARLSPEVARVDLSEAVLTLKAGGIDDLDAFPWFERPPETALKPALALLRNLGALDRSGGLTDTGRRMAAFPAHPRYARFFLAASDFGCLRPALLVAAFAQGRSLLQPLHDKSRAREREELLLDAAAETSDFYLLLRAFALARSRQFDPRFCKGWGIHGQAARQAERAAGQFARVARAQGLDPEAEPTDDPEALRKAVLIAFSDHLARRRDRATLRCEMVQGRNAELRHDSAVQDAPLLVAAEIEERSKRGEVVTLLGLATAVEEDWLEALFPEDYEERAEVYWQKGQKRVLARRVRRFRDLELAAEESGEPPEQAAAELLAGEILAGNVELRTWTPAVEQFIRRVNLIAERRPDYAIAPIDDTARRLLLEEICLGARSQRQVQDAPVMPALKNWLSPEQLSEVERLAPETWLLPNRKKPAKLRYEADGSVVLASKLQDFYDVPGDSLRICEGEIPLKIELLAPNQRPCQVTDDLDRFWQTSYEMVKKDLKGRYPKHEWR